MLGIAAQHQDTALRYPGPTVTTGMGFPRTVPPVIRQSRLLCWRDDLFWRCLLELTCASAWR
eukprot:2272119-Rhodomonas_salina.1